MTNEFYFRSSTGQKIYARKWIDETKKEYKGIMQLVHGMQEHIGRYNEFAEYLAKEGYIVYGHDHLGHGNTNLEKDYIYFAKKDGYLRLAEDVHILQNEIKKEYEKLPYIILGHSMGSLIVRTYLTIYKDDIDKAILMGTSGREKDLNAGIILATIIKIIRGEKYKSKLLRKLINGNFSKQFEGETGLEWLTSDVQKLSEYKNDKKCNKTFSVSAYIDLLKMSKYLTKKENIIKIPNIPILFISGKNDPVGENGTGVYRAYNKLKELGKDKITIRLFEDGRHEILNEPIKMDVYYAIIDWIQNKNEEK